MIRHALLVFYDILVDLYQCEIFHASARVYKAFSEHSDYFSVYPHLLKPPSIQLLVPQNRILEPNNIFQG